MRFTTQDQAVAVVGATGHTGGFVVDELDRRGRKTVLVGRAADKLAAVRSVHRASAVRLARLDDAGSLDQAPFGAAAVINCAGPFLDTALAVVDAALRAGIPYLDLTAEQAAVRLLDRREAEARDANVLLLPAAAFYGGLADLLATSAAGDWPTLDEISVAVALDSWHPTQGTRLTGERNTAPRLIVADSVLQPVPDPPPKGTWAFPAPFGRQDVSMLPLSETITLSRHLHAASIQSWINGTALRDVGDPTTAPPEPSDERGRSSQRFVMDVLVRWGERRRRATALGQDIYAISAPIVVEALERILAGEAAAGPGVRSLGEVVDATAFLEALTRGDGLRVQWESNAPAVLERT
jgi:hypothetical protein